MRKFMYDFKKDIFYESELFLGCRLKFPKFKTKATVFHNGKIYLTGSSDIEEIETVCKFSQDNMKKYIRK